MKKYEIVKQLAGGDHDIFVGRLCATAVDGDGKALLGGGLLPRGDEACQKVPSGDWMLSSAGGVIGELPAGFVERIFVGSPAGRLEVRQRVSR